MRKHTYAHTQTQTHTRAHTHTHLRGECVTDYSRDFQIIYDDAAQSCTIRFRCFDTPNAVTVYGPETSTYAAEDMLHSVRRMCLEYHRLWSFSLPESDVSRINAACERVEVDPRTADIVSRMREFHDVEPAFDFTVGAVSYLWKHARRLPTERELAEAMNHVAAGCVRVEGSAIVKADPLAKIDVGGAAKGVVADAIAAYLRKCGVTCADVDLGGNLFMLGKHPAGRPWRVSVKIPEGVAVKPIVVDVVDSAAATSGSYERFVEIEGRRYQHIIDARTGWPCVNGIVSATVFSSSALEADLLATTTCLLGSQGFAALAGRHPACRFVAITEGGGVLRA